VPGEPNYYEILGVAPTADAATIGAAYNSRSMKFRVGLFDDRPRTLSGPTQEEVERAYAVLSDPEQRASYDLEYFPAAVQAAAVAGQQAQDRRRRLVGVVAALCLVGIVVVLVLAATVRGPRRNDAISQVLAEGTGVRATMTASAAVAATATEAGAATATAGPPTPTAPAAALAVPVTPAAPAPTATSTPSPTAAPSLTPAPSPTIPPTPTQPPAPTATATTPPPPTPAPPPPPTTTPVPPRPVPAFRPTDVVGTALPVNFREGPGTAYAILGTLPKGTPLAATGRTAVVNGVLWRQFTLANSSIGWMRDMDVLPAR
jgi:hypothetical protein